MSVVHMKNTGGFPIPLCETSASPPFEFTGNWDLVTCRYCLAYVCCRCNYDTHYCPGCGADLKHGVEVCEDCTKRLSDEGIRVDIETVEEN